MKFYRVQRENIEVEYGQARSMTQEWMAELTYAEHLNRIDVAHLSIRKAFIQANLLPQRMNIELIQRQPNGIARYRIVGEYEDRARNQAYPKPMLSTNMESVQTSFDVFGNPLVVAYKDDMQIGTAEVFRPRAHLSVNVKVNLSAYGVTVNDILDAWVGKINYSRWHGFLPHTVLCTGINAQPEYETYDLRVRIWHLEFQFVINPETWVQWVFYRGPDGTIPPDIQYGTGYYDFLPYVPQEFNMLFPLAGVPL